MSVIPITWKHRERNDGEIATAHVSHGLKLVVQDCDGDFSCWHIFRDGRGLLVAGETHGNEPYHFDTAKAKAAEVLGFVLKADQINEFAREDKAR